MRVRDRSHVWVSGCCVFFFLVDDLSFKTEHNDNTHKNNFSAVFILKVNVWNGPHRIGHFEFSQIIRTSNQSTSVDFLNLCYKNLHFIKLIGKRIRTREKKSVSVAAFEIIRSLGYRYFAYVHQYIAKWWLLVLLRFHLSHSGLIFDEHFLFVHLHFSLCLRLNAFFMCYLKRVDLLLNMRPQCVNRSEWVCSINLLIGHKFI